jgi:hypothetical protein
LGPIPWCGDNGVDNTWVIQVANRSGVAYNPSNQTCGLHTRTNQPDSALINVMIQYANGDPSQTIGGCDLVCVSPDDTLVIDFTAFDQDGFLGSYGLELLYGYDQSVTLVDSTTGATASTVSISPSPAAPSWAPAPAAGQCGPLYLDALAGGATSPTWNGGTMRLTVSAGVAFPTVPCAYLLELTVYDRTIVDCGDASTYTNVSFESFTVKAC